MNDEFLKHLTDRFYGWELVELLDISIERIVSLLQDDVLDNKEFLEDYILHGN